jgi:hypothetical protein
MYRLTITESLFWAAELIELAAALSLIGVRLAQHSL